MILRTLVLACLLSASALACSYFPPVHKVPRSFIVHVRNDIGPVVGLTLKVSRFKADEYAKLTDEQQRSVDESKFEETFGEAVTDADGTAPFRLKSTGSFTLSIVSPANQLDWVELEVSEKAPSADIALQWPRGILRTSRLRGRLMKGLYSSQSVALGGLALRLHRPADYREVSAVTTASDGSFDFKDVVPGLYFVEMVPGNKKSNDLYQPEGNIAVYVTPDAAADRLEISTANTSCGLMYDLEANKSRYAPGACFKGGKPVQCDY